MMDDFNADRRRFPRFSKMISVDINGKVFPVSEKLEQEAEGKDISVSGLCFNSPTPYEIGAKLIMDVRITTPESIDNQSGVTISRASNPISCVAEVVRIIHNPEVGEFEIAVRFLDVTDEDYRVLIRHLAED
ncbi:MAG: PilZ domain-containing protein [Desulfatibacillum sp.]|nr:PilZ domain-containing protein [Desulfatibacillum sp.]